MSILKKNETLRFVVIGSILTSKSKLRENLESTLLENQERFRSGRGTQHWLFPLRQIAERTLIENENFTLDIGKAFDTLSRSNIWSSFRNIGIQKDFIQAILRIFIDIGNIIRAENEFTTIFHTHKGVRQGRVLRPLLFAAVMDDKVRYASKSTKGIRVELIACDKFLPTNFYMWTTYCLSKRTRAKLSIDIWQKTE